MQDKARFIEANEQETYSIPYSIPLSQPQLALLRHSYQDAEHIRRLDENYGIKTETGMFMPFDPRNPDLQEQLGVQEWRLVREARALQGITAITGEYVTKHVQKSTRRSFRQIAFAMYDVPEENEEATLAALDSGKFEKEFLSEDLPVLLTMWQLSETIREQGGSSGAHLPPPRISTEHLARVLETDEASVTESLYRLSGLLARTHQQFAYFTRLSEPRIVARVTPERGNFIITRRAERRMIESQR